ncbi:unnamed protein product [Pleuronectes platessa]|uniref:Uncharacterized protein n=1 Tax=Pleuronectes platessa TaxID=8262 RepID=A0A9N7TSB6_PLEPL|nr:unnamed protein product [Pleuronectes platessa]
MESCGVSAAREPELNAAVWFSHHSNHITQSGFTLVQGWPDFPRSLLPWNIKTKLLRVKTKTARRNKLKSEKKDEVAVEREEWKLEEKMRKGLKEGLQSQGSSSNQLPKPPAVVKPQVHPIQTPSDPFNLFYRSITQPPAISRHVQFCVRL